MATKSKQQRPWNIRWTLFYLYGNKRKKSLCILSRKKKLYFRSQHKHVWHDKPCPRRLISYTRLHCLSYNLIIAGCHGDKLYTFPQKLRNVSLFCFLFGHLQDRTRMELGIKFCILTSLTIGYTLPFSQT